LNDETRYKSNKGYEFKWWCGVNVPQGDKAKEGGVVFDYLSFFAYSIDDCMEACGNMNQKDDENHTGLRCKSVVFSKRMSADYNAQNGNCWLKNASKSALVFLFFLLMKLLLTLIGVATGDSRRTSSHMPS
jgi:hypothetical protein